MHMIAEVVYIIFRISENNEHNVNNENFILM